MKKHIFTTVLIICSLIVFGQEGEKEEHPHLLEAKEWGSEFFTFPISFANEIPFSGYEEAVFPPGWSNQESQEFWSYVFAWNVEAITPLTIQDFETNLNSYFDGLMDIQNRKNGFTILESRATIVKNKDFTTGDHYIGSIYLYEGRYTKRMMTLYVMAEQHYCKIAKETTVVFRFSPKPFDAEIWNALNKVSIIEGCK